MLTLIQGKLHAMYWKTPGASGTVHHNCWGEFIIKGKGHSRRLTFLSLSIAS